MSVYANYHCPVATSYMFPIVEVAIQTQVAHKPSPPSPLHHTSSHCPPEAIFIVAEMNVCAVLI